MPVHRSLGASRLTPSTLPVGDATDMGYSQSKATHDLCVNVLVRPMRISPLQSGAARPCSTLQGCTARPGSSVTYCSQQRRPGRVPSFIGANRHRRTPCICAWVPHQSSLREGICGRRANPAQFPFFTKRRPADLCFTRIVCFDPTPREGRQRTLIAQPEEQFHL